MRAFTLNTKSWHGRLATTYGFLQQHVLRCEGTDVCTYIRAVSLGSLVVLVLTAIIATVCVGIQDALIWGYFRFWLGINISPSEIAATVMAIIFGLTIIATVLFALAGGVTSYENITTKIKKLDAENKTPFMVLAYRAFKGKFCARLEFN